MAKATKTLSAKHRELIAAQHLFFVATAPRAGRINLSPRGMDLLRCLGPRRLAWLDLTGSGNETAAHLLDDGRITLMWCSFADKPLILRVYGRGRAVQPGAEEWEALAAALPSHPAARQIVVVEVESVASSCGWGVPRYELVGVRGEYDAWARRKGADELVAYRARHNAVSIDGLPTGLVAPEPAPPRRR